MDMFNSDKLRPAVLEPAQRLNLSCKQSDIYIDFPTFADLFNGLPSLPQCN
jgi:hypothetical protein